MRPKMKHFKDLLVIKILVPALALFFNFKTPGLLQKYNSANKNKKLFYFLQQILVILK